MVTRVGVPVTQVHFLHLAEALQLLRGRAAGFRAALTQLQAIAARPGGKDPAFVDLTLRYGLDYCEWVVKWCETQERRLRRRAA